MRENGNHDAAFPCPHSEAWSNNQDGAPYQAGMTLRDYFAGQALIGLSQADMSEEEFSVGPDLLARTAYRMADAMLAARKENANA